LGYARWGAALVAAAGALVPGAAGAQAPPTNYELAQRAAQAACVELVGKLRPSVEDSVLAVRGVGTSPGNFLVENAMSNALTEAGLAVRTKADSAVGCVVEFEVADLGLDYPRVHRSALFGRKRVEREARARVFARLVDHTQGRILWADQAESRQRDEVDASKLPELEEKNPATYLKATVPPERWNKLVEPIVVTGIIAGLIILFFSNQSTN
jgi:hypothetical protein